MAASEKSKKKENFLTQFRLNHKLHAADFMSIWVHYDKSQSGFLEEKEIKNFLKDLVKAKGEKADQGSLSIYEDVIMSSFDRNKDGKIEIGELASLLPVEDNFVLKYTCRTTLTRKDFDDIFKHYDKSQTGFLNNTELLALLRDLFERNGQHIGQKDLEDYAKAVYEVYDKSEDGQLTQDEVGILLSKTV